MANQLCFSISRGLSSMMWIFKAFVYSHHDIIYVWKEERKKRKGGGGNQRRMEEKKEGRYNGFSLLSHLFDHLPHIFLLYHLIHWKIIHHAVAFKFQNEIDESLTSYVTSRTAFPSAKWKLELYLSHIALLWQLHSTLSKYYISLLKS